MKINLDRLCRLAGVDSNSSSGLIREGADHEAHEMAYEAEEETTEGGMYEESEEAEEADDMEEMIEVDETMLVQELRRAKRIMKENHERSRRRRLSESKRKEKLLEAELKQIIESEVSALMKELNLNSGWLYGNKKPSRSKKGHVHQGSYLKGIGFK